MDHHEPAERERSEPCSARTNPFTDDEENTSRKRQRIANGGSRSRSVDTARDLDLTIDSTSPREGNNKAEAPHTPPRMPSEPPPEPTSSRVTINLRTNRSLESISSSPSPSTMIHGGDDAGTRISVESESDALSTIPAIETPSSSPSESGSPQVELVTMVEDDSDFDSRDPPLAIIGEDEVYIDPMLDFPYSTEAETLVQTVHKVAHYLQYDEVVDQSCFCRIRDWIDKYLRYTSDPTTFYEMYIKYREVWIKFPELIWVLSRRSRFFGQFLNRSREGRLALTEMLSQFARLVGRFLAMDVKSLEYYAKKSSNDHGPDLASHGYLSAYSFLLRKEEGSHIGRNLETHYNWNWDDDIAILSDSFQTEGGTIGNLMKLVQGQSTLIERNPKLADNFTEPCRIAAKMVSDATYMLEERDTHYQQPVEAAQIKLVHGYEFFRAMSSCLEFIIEKHVTHISPDSTGIHLANLTAIYRNTLTFENPKTREILEKFTTNNATIIRKQIVKAISYEWKFTVLKKLITSAQMQLRVIGVTTMCTDLLHLYGLDKAVEPSSNPLLLYFADFVLRNQLVDYIVGIGSHPEIINESSNIVGFLIVTKTYKNQQTDRIWQTVMTSQDPRVVEAIVRMVLRCLNLFDYQALLYLCKKVSEVPMEAFTATMRDFCSKLFHDLVAKAGPEGVHYMKTPPYDLCVRLIRESSITTSDAPIGYPDIQGFAANRLQHLLQYGPPSEGRHAIYLSCIQDVSSRTPTAPGSICVINALLRQYMATDLRVLTTEHGLTQLMVEELESTVVGDCRPSDQSARISQASHARRELLLMIITHEPRTITPELGKRLWNVLVGSESKTVTDRNTSWQILNSAVKKSALNNVFLASCFRDYFPNLPSQCFTSGSLDFAREAIISWMEEVRRDFVEEDRKFESQALDQLWRMILTAPPNTIDASAISILVDVYVDSGLISSLPRAKSRSIHLALVERCLDQLKGAATQLKAYSDGASSGSEEGMVIVASEDQFQEQEMIFARSLAVLREFLRAYQAKPQFATPKSRPLVTATSNTVEGEPLTVKYQSFDGDKHTEVKSLTLGKLNTAASLFASLQKATGFKNYKVYCDGKLFDPDEVEVCKSLDDLNLNGLVLVQRREDVEGSPSHSSGSKTSLELEITKHFDDLWGYLSMHDKVAQEIHYFLVKFPVYGRLLEELNSESTPYSEIFPVGQPFKSLYAIHALRESIVGSSQKGNTSESALTRAISLIVAALSDRAVFANCATDDLRDCLAMHFIDCLVQLLREPVLPASAGPLLNDALLQRLLQLISDAKTVAGSNNSIHLTFRSFEAMLEASLHSPEFWKSFRSHLSSSTLLRDLLLEDPRPIIRKSVTKQIVNRCNFTPSLAQVSATDLTLAFWPMVSALIEEAVLQPQNCEEVFTLSLALFRKLGESPLQFQSLDDLVKHWGALFLSHPCNERVGHPESIDMVAQGLANLLYCAASFSKASQQILSCSAVGTELFRKHLFPELSVDEDDDLIIVPRLPLLSPVTRQTLAETILHLIKDDETQYKEILTSLSALVPYAAVEDGPYIYDLGYFFDRTKSIRSHTGYVGLRNLSNTCYLNSLFTQLFMNIPFREFMLTAHVADGGNQQKLLSETQNLFSYMQNSLRRFVDPTNLANSIQTYDNSNIDVSIQMDVDEFYNLLFDRWEGQILSDDAKRKFKSFYGGQLVQQVKSKECPHISEREESFSAIQCDIKGKTSLEESLQAYVEGEVMEGDNKYKCSTCDRHVDAVKRACLKEIPDNLIFHLKRFDFNLRTLQRSKINDYFAFPKTIDMRPYKVEHLMDCPDETPEDVFELVGVLVHSGTAESGHYYSFIRERPSNSDKENWVEFNDECVTPWDANCMESSCFGGVDYRGPVNGGDMQYDKSYSAYMLFYQRSSVLAQQKQALETSDLASPVRLEIPARLANHIAMENELLMRKYCLYDPSHAIFVAKMLANIKQINGGQCSATHGLEKLALTSALNHLDQVIARTKDLPDFMSFLNAVRQVCHSCAECSRDYLEWYCDCPETLRHLLLRNPDAVVRSEISNSILAALNKVKVDASYAYGFGDDDDSADELDGGDPQLIQRVVKCINKLWDIFHTNCRAWPEYFGLLSNIAKMGDPESALLLDNGFLRKTLEMVSADPLLPLGQQYSRMLNIISKRIATRPVSFEAVISLLCKLIKTCDTSMDPISDDENRLERAMSRLPIPLASTERHLLAQHWTRNDAHILTEKLLQIHQNQYATRAIIVHLLEWQQNIDHNICQAIIHGIRKGVSSVLSGPFLRAALIYCEHSEEEKAIPFMIQHVAKVAYHVDNAEGKEFLQFFKDVIEIPSNKSNTPREDILRFVLENVNFWGPGLLTYYDNVVRIDTETLIQDVILGHGPEVDFGPADENGEKADMIIQAAHRLGVACLDFIQETYIRQRAQAVRATMVNIQAVIEACAEFFDDEAKDLLTRRFFDQKATVLSALRKCIVEEADEETSDWEASDGEYPSSEPMDSIGPLNDDLNDTDVQL